MPKQVTKTGQITKAYGETLPTPLDIVYNYEELQKGDEVPAKEVPDEEDIRNVVNAKRNASARAKAQTELYKDNNIKAPDMENNPELQIRNMAKVFMAAGKSQADAEQAAKAALGY